MSQKNPIGFLSYVRDDDEHERGRLTEICKRLSSEVRMQSGDKFHIFQDRNDIAWGQQWKERIKESVDATTFLFPIITPGFLKSPACRDELEGFLKREKQLKRKDLILPIYYVNCKILNDKVKRKADKLAEVIAARQYSDWRELRFESLTSIPIAKIIAAMATQIVDALERGQTTRSSRARTAVKLPKKATRTAPAIEMGRMVAAVAERGPTEKSEPPTHIVDNRDSSKFQTIVGALEKAAPGDRILVRPGLYREGIKIVKSVEIIGDGKPGEVVLEANDGHAILFRANMGRIVNLTIRNTGKDNQLCVSIARGRLDLEECDITSKNSACVGIFGGADPRLRRNRIHGAENSGVLVWDNGLGTLEDNDIFGNADAGVTIWNGGNSTLRHNRISKNGYVGIYVFKGGQGVFEENDLRGNESGAWEIEKDCLDKVKRTGNLE